MRQNCSTSLFMRQRVHILACTACSAASGARSSRRRLSSDVAHALHCTSGAASLSNDNPAHQCETLLFSRLTEVPHSLSWTPPSATPEISYWCRLSTMLCTLSLQQLNGLGARTAL